MNLILSDRGLDELQKQHPEIPFIDLSKQTIKNCIGCFGCWTKTPGKCVIRDDAVNIYPRIAASEQILYISKIQYGGYDTTMKTMLERSIPIQQAFIRLLDGETHHIQRKVVPKHAVIIGYGDTSLEEQELFRQLVARNAKNMCFQEYRVIFVSEAEVEHAAINEVATWKK